MESKSVIELFLYQLLEVLAGDRCVIGVKRDNELLVSVSDELSPLSPQAVRIAQASTPAVQRANALNSFLSFIFIVLSIIINSTSAFSLAYYSTSLEKNQHQTMFFT